MFNVYKNQLSRQTGSRNLTGPKTLPTIWHTYMKLVTKYQISAINSCWEKSDEIYLGRTEGQTDRGKTVYPLPVEWGYNKRTKLHLLKIQKDVNVDIKWQIIFKTCYIINWEPNINYKCGRSNVSQLEQFNGPWLRYIYARQKLQTIKHRCTCIWIVLVFYFLKW
jgi:hypothetical protein